RWRPMQPSCSLRRRGAAKRGEHQALRRRWTEGAALPIEPSAKARGTLHHLGPLDVHPGDEHARRAVEADALGLRSTPDDDDAHARSHAELAPGRSDGRDGVAPRAALSGTVD